MATSKKIPAKKTAAKAPAPAKPAAKAAPTKAAPAKPAAAPASSASKAPMSAGELKRKILERKSAGPAKSIAFSLDEVREIAKKNEKQPEAPAKVARNGVKAPVAVVAGKPADLHAKVEKPAKPNHIKPASLSDILGFNPSKGRKPHLELDESKVQEKFRRYYRLLVDLRNHVLTQLGEHTEETLLKSAKDDSGDLSGYGQHMADAGTDTFDRDFALSLVSSEQEALSEIEAAIKRIYDGTYGVCESTHQPIAKERLLAVPFTRYSAEAKKEVERHSHRSQQRGGLFGDSTEEDGAKVTEDAGGDDE